jgi:hypothetical protein
VEYFIKVDIEYYPTSVGITVGNGRSVASIESVKSSASVDDSGTIGVAEGILSADCLFVVGGTLASKARQAKSKKSVIIILVFDFMLSFRFRPGENEYSKGLYCIPK